MGINLATEAMRTERGWCEGTQGEHLVEAEHYISKARGRWEPQKLEKQCASVSLESPVEHDAADAFVPDSQPAGQ